MNEIKLPYNIEAEAAFLGALLIDNRLADEIPVPLGADHFYEPLHGRIFTQTVNDIAAGKTVTGVTLKPYFEADEAMKAVGGVGYLAQLTGSGAGIIGFRSFAQQIFDLAVMRELVAVGREIVDRALDTSESIDPRALVDDAEQRLGSITGADHGDKQAYSAAECVDEVMAEWDRPAAGVRCGCIPELDEAIGKIKPTEFILGAGRPGSGKTALAISYGNGVARKALDPNDSDGGGVLFFSHEMSALQVGGRLITDTAAYSYPLLYQRVESGELDEDERKRVRAIRDELRKVPFQIVPIGTLTVVEMRRRVRRWKRIFEKRGVPLRLVIVDYLQLMSGSKKSRDENRQAEISEISRGLKQLAMSEDVGVFALSQLSRAVENRDPPKPQPKDLRESGSLEQDADKIILLYSEYTYHLQKQPQRGSKDFLNAIIDWQADCDALKDKIEFIIGKRRNGAYGMSITARFLREYQAMRGAPRG
ncbi:DnaB-like helicase C-terminal domain-containing protein [Sphingopyxis macrogoltabida]|uniref:DNA 5'-3' helicase n=1 Tax=Sphingopyxis macrogoltabida TaxID=33050 RepID=A0AAC9AXH8_SPHMC|nr:DnaB-like helicase C-terminal domain-containing protein [Sphingopyxis macrogoltabida]ALJ15345.1 error-prone DNA polymerase [Sphingopyxis macrogoltabida]AMU91594.1 hypothetical protein ATM17_21500 [Sphingopyxis macrogoltabida]